jgi:hypothetical protein
MKIFSSRVSGALAAAALFCLAAPESRAFISEDGSHVEIFAGYLGGSGARGDIGGFTVEADPGGGAVFGLRGGSNFTDRWGFEASLGYAPSWSWDFRSGGASADEDADAWILDASVGWFSHPFKKATFFLYGGPSYMRLDFKDASSWDRQDGYGLHGGAALFGFVLPRGGYLRLDARYRFIEDALGFDGGEENYRGLEASLSAGFTF